MSGQSLVEKAEALLELARTYEALPPEQRLRSPEHDQLDNLVDSFQHDLRGPVYVVSRNEVYYVHLIAVQAIHRFQVPANVPQEGTISYAELAKLCKTNQSTLERLIRFAITGHIFEEPEKGFVKHNEASKALLDIEGCNEVLGIVAETLWPAATRTVDALVKWPNSDEPNETGFNLAMDTSASFNQYIGSDPTRIMRFSSAMKFLSTERGTSPLPILDSPPIQAILHTPGQTIVDIGGGSGGVAKMLLARSESLHCIVQDIPEVVGSFAVPPELTGKLSYEGHDFFQPQPARNADAYLMRNVLHNWSDKYALKLLQGLVPAMKSGTRILIHECCIPKHGDRDVLRERSIRAYDIGMLSLLNGKERDEDAWIELFGQADSRFQFVAVHTFPSSFASLVEFRWTGTS